MAANISRAKGRAAARIRRHVRLRKKIVGTESRPRLVVTRSSRHVFVQVIDDAKGLTLASASTMEADLRSFDRGELRAMDVGYGTTLVLAPLIFCAIARSSGGLCLPNPEFDVPAFLRLQADTLVRGLAPLAKGAAP